MKYQISQKVLAVGGDYSVRDESGKEVYYFDGKLFNLGGKKVCVLDAQRKEVARLKKKIFSYNPSFTLQRNGIVAATIRKRSFTVRDQVIIDVPGSNDYTVIGDYIGHEYTIKRGPNDIARISKKFFGATDSYGVDVFSGDPILVLSAVVVIDMVLFKKLKTAH